MQRRIVEDLRAGRPEALDLMLETYGREIQAVAFLIVRDRFDAEDIAIETLLTAWKRASQLRDPEALRPWLLRIAANKSLSHRRRGTHVVPLHVVAERSDALGQPDVTRIALLTGVGELPPAMRAAIVLRYYADLSVEETAIALGKSPNTIKAQLRVALDRLRLSVSELDAPKGAEAGHA